MDWTGKKSRPTFHQENYRRSEISYPYDIRASSNASRINPLPPTQPGYPTSSQQRNTSFPEVDSRSAAIPAAVPAPSNPFLRRTTAANTIPSDVSHNLQTESFETPADFRAHLSKPIPATSAKPTPDNDEEFNNLRRNSLIRLSQMLPDYLRQKVEWTPDQIAQLKDLRADIFELTIHPPGQDDVQQAREIWQHLNVVVDKLVSFHRPFKNIESTNPIPQLNDRKVVIQDIVSHLQNLEKKLIAIGIAFTEQNKPSGSQDQMKANDTSPRVGAQTTQQYCDQVSSSLPHNRVGFPPAGVPSPMRSTDNQDNRNEPSQSAATVPPSYYSQLEDSSRKHSSSHAVTVSGHHFQKADNQSGWGDPSVPSDFSTDRAAKILSSPLSERRQQLDKFAQIEPKLTSREQYSASHGAFISGSNFIESESKNSEEDRFRTVDYKNVAQNYEEDKRVVHKGGGSLRPTFSQSRNENFGANVHSLNSQDFQSERVAESRLLRTGESTYRNESKLEESTITSESYYNKPRGYPVTNTDVPHNYARVPPPDVLNIEKVEYSSHSYDEQKRSNPYPPQDQVRKSRLDRPHDKYPSDYNCMPDDKHYQSEYHQGSTYESDSIEGEEDTRRVFIKSIRPSNRRNEDVQRDNVKMTQSFDASNSSLPNRIEESAQTARPTFANNASQGYGMGRDSLLPKVTPRDSLLAFSGRPSRNTSLLPLPHYEPTSNRQKSPASLLPLPHYEPANNRETSRASSLQSHYEPANNRQSNAASSLPSHYEPANNRQSNAASSLPSQYEPANNRQSNAASSLPSQYEPANNRQSNAAPSLPSHYEPANNRQSNAASSLPSHYEPANTRQSNAASSLSSHYEPANNRQSGTGSFIPLSQFESATNRQSNAAPSLPSQYEPANRQSGPGSFIPLSQFESANNVQILPTSDYWQRPELPQNTNPIKSDLEIPQGRALPVWQFGGETVKEFDNVKPKPKSPVKEERVEIAEAQPRLTLLEFEMLEKRLKCLEHYRNQVRKDLKFLSHVESSLRSAQVGEVTKFLLENKSIEKEIRKADQTLSREIKELSHTVSKHMTFFKPSGVIIYKDGRDHWCPECNILSPSIEEALQHLNTAEHRSKVDSVPNFFPMVRGCTKRQVCVGPAHGSEFLYFCDSMLGCSICEKVFGDDQHALNHLQSILHNSVYKTWSSKRELYEEKQLNGKNACLTKLAMEELKAKQEKFAEQRQKRKVREEKESAEKKKQKPLMDDIWMEVSDTEEGQVDVIDTKKDLDVEITKFIPSSIVNKNRSREQLTKSKNENLSVNSDKINPSVSSDSGSNPPSTKSHSDNKTQSKQAPLMVEPNVRKPSSAETAPVVKENTLKRKHESTAKKNPVKSIDIFDVDNEETAAESEIQIKKKLPPLVATEANTTEDKSLPDQSSIRSASPPVSHDDSASATASVFVPRNIIKTGCLDPDTSSISGDKWQPIDSNQRKESGATAIQTSFSEKPSSLHNISKESLPPPVKILPRKLRKK